MGKEEREKDLALLVRKSFIVFPIGNGKTKPFFTSDSTRCRHLNSLFLHNHEKELEGL